MGVPMSATYRQQFACFSLASIAVYFFHSLTFWVRWLTFSVRRLSSIPATALGCCGIAQKNQSAKWPMENWVCLVVYLGRGRFSVGCGKVETGASRLTLGHHGSHFVEQFWPVELAAVGAEMHRWAVAHQLGGLPDAQPQVNPQPQREAMA